MNKLHSKIMVAVVCALLGFILAYEFKVISRQDTTTQSSQGANITVDIEQLKHQKDEMSKKITELQSSISKYEGEIAESSGTSKELLEELNNSRMLLGDMDVQGQGIRIDITPKSNIIKSNPIGSGLITDENLVFLVNELNFADAEAISINGIRVTYRTGIRNASDYILVGDDKISPTAPIVILAIGNKDNLNKALDFPGELSSIEQSSNIAYQKVDNIVIPKANKALKSDYIKPVNK